MSIQPSKMNRMIWADELDDEHVNDTEFRGCDPERLLDRDHYGRPNPNPWIKVQRKRRLKRNPASQLYSPSNN